MKKQLKAFLKAEGFKDILDMLLKWHVKGNISVSAIVDYAMEETGEFIISFDDLNNLAIRHGLLNKKARYRPPESRVKRQNLCVCCKSPVLIKMVDNPKMCCACYNTASRRNCNVLNEHRGYVGY